MQTAKWKRLVFVGALLTTGFSAQDTTNNTLTFLYIKTNISQNFPSNFGSLGDAPAQVSLDISSGSVTATISTQDGSLIAISLKPQDTTKFTYSPTTCNIKQGQSCLITFTRKADQVRTPFSVPVLVSGIRLRDNVSTNIVTLTVINVVDGPP